MVDLCLEQQNELIEACLNGFWAVLDGLGLGFHRRRRENDERREKTEKKRNKERK